MIIKDNLIIFDEYEESRRIELEFKKEIYYFIKELNIKNLDSFIEEIKEMYEIEITNNGVIISDYQDEIYLSNKEIEEMMED